jgi:hypothetical protein
MASADAVAAALEAIGALPWAFWAGAAVGAVGVVAGGLRIRHAWNAASSATGRRAVEDAWTQAAGELRRARASLAWSLGVSIAAVVVLGGLGLLNDVQASVAAGVCTLLGGIGAWWLAGRAARAGAAGTGDSLPSLAALGLAVALASLALAGTAAISATQPDGASWWAALAGLPIGAGAVALGTRRQLPPASRRAIDAFCVVLGSITGAALLGWVVPGAMPDLVSGTRARLTGLLSALPLALGAAGVLAMIVPRSRGLVPASILTGIAGVALAFVLFGADRDTALLFSHAGVPAWWALAAIVLIGVAAALVLDGVSRGRASDPDARPSLAGGGAGLFALAGAGGAAAVLAGAARDPLLGFFGVGLASVALVTVLGAARSAKPANAPAPSSDQDAGANRVLIATAAAALAAAGFGALAVDSARANLNALLAAWAEESLAPGVPDRPTGVYTGHETFAVIIPMGDPGNDATQDAFVTGAVLADRNQFATWDELTHVEPGHRFDIELVGASIRAGETAGRAGWNGEPAEFVESRLVRLKTRFAHGDHFHDMAFTAVLTHRASITDTLAATGGSLAGWPTLAGLAVGAGVVLVVAGARRTGRGSGVWPVVLAVGLPIVAGAVWTTGGLAGLAGGVAVAGLALGVAAAVPSLRGRVVPEGHELLPAVVVVTLTAATVLAAVPWTHRGLSAAAPANATPNTSTDR